MKQLFNEYTLRQSRSIDENGEPVAVFDAFLTNLATQHGFSFVAAALHDEAKLRDLMGCGFTPEEAVDDLRRQIVAEAARLKQRADQIAADAAITLRDWENEASQPPVRRPFIPPVADESGGKTG